MAGTFGAVLFSVLIQRATLGRLIDGLKASPSPAMENSVATGAD